MREFINQFKHWLIHLFAVHCEECNHAKECKNCEVLRSLLETEKYEKQQLFIKLFDAQNKPEEEPELDIDYSRLKEISRKYQPWKMRQQLLQDEDREKARAIRELEKEVGINASE